jgi:phosphorylated CTD-interacting factor 1
MSNSKKRKSSDNQVGLFNLVGVVGIGEEADDSLECLLAEMDGVASGHVTSGGQSTVATSSGGLKTSDTMTTGEARLWDLSNDVITTRNSEKIAFWNNALRLWTKTGKYSEGLLPNFDLELARHFQVEKLSKLLLKSAEGLKMPTFERWLIDSKLEEEKSADPVLPNVDVDSGASQRLLREVSQILDTEKAHAVLQNLCLQTLAAVQELSVLSRRTARKCPLSKGDRVSIENRDDNMIALLYSRKAWKKPYCIKINISHYNKLKTMFERVHGEISPKAMHAYHLIVMCLMLRYSSLSGGQLLTDLRGGGMQGAINPQVFLSLKRIFGQPCLEVFASPMNAFYPQFGSAFADLDWHFGSFGDFFEQRGMEEGCFEANPPFSPGLMMKMATEMQRRLEKADEAGRSLTFVVVVPSAESKVSLVANSFASQSYELLRKLACKHVLLKSREHGYVEGAQHIKPTRYKQSAYDTSVLILQSEAAVAKRMADFASIEDILRKSFASQHDVELRERKRALPGPRNKKKT